MDTVVVTHVTLCMQRKMKKPFGQLSFSIVRDFTRSSGGPENGDERIVLTGFGLESLSKMDCQPGNMWVW